MATVGALVGATVASVQAQPMPAAPPASIVNDEGGPVRIVGTGSYSAADTTDEIHAPAIAVVNVGPYYVERNALYTAPGEAMVFGYFTSPFDRSPFTYEVALPAEPRGPLIRAGAGQDGGPGVQVWAVNIYNDNQIYPQSPLLLPLEQVSQAFLGSLKRRLPDGLDAIYEPVGGALLVYAAEPDQAFPGGFGADARLFTDDDPLVRLPRGWTLVRLDRGGFVFDRSRVADVPILEGEYRRNPDLASLGFVDAFEAYIALMKERYAYTELRGIGWESWRQELLPRIRQAEEASDAAAFDLVFADLVLRIQDSHVQLRPARPDSLQAISARGRSWTIGLEPPPPSSEATWPHSLVQTDDGRVFVTRVAPGSEAEAAGIRPGAELLEANGRSISQYLNETAAEAPHGSHSRRLAEALKLTLHLGETLTLTFRNPDDAPRRHTFQAPDRPMPMGSPGVGPAPAAPTARSVNEVDTQLIGRPDRRRYLYVRWTRFFNDPVVVPAVGSAISRWRTAQAMILDLRGNLGGMDPVSTTLVSYFFEPQRPFMAEHFVTRRFDPEAGHWVTGGAFQLPPRFPIYAPSPSLYYAGPVVILADAHCASMCEFFSAWMQRSGRATVISPDEATAGAGGFVYTLPLPTGAEVSYTYTQELDRESDLPYVEMVGVRPDMKVPVDEEFVASLLAGEDPVLDFAIEWLDGQTR